MGAGGGPPLGIAGDPEACGGKKTANPEVLGANEKVKKTRSRSGQKRNKAARTSTEKAARRKGAVKEEGKRPSRGSA